MQGQQVVFDLFEHIKCWKLKNEFWKAEIALLNYSPFTERGGYEHIHITMFQINECFAYFIMDNYKLK